MSSIKPIAALIFGLMVMAQAPARQWITSPHESVPKTGELRSLQDRLPAVFNLKDWGAIGDGKTNDTAAFEACKTASAMHDRPVVVPEGDYLIYGHVLTAQQVAELGMSGRIP
jgi:polygalacturonase